MIAFGRHAAPRYDRTAQMDACYAPRPVVGGRPMAACPRPEGPNPAAPQTNMMHLYFEAPAETVLWTAATPSPGATGS